MRNPWLDLPHQAPFVLPGDVAAITTFNLKATDRTRIYVDLLPEPFLGNPNAPVVLLISNPGFSIEDAACHADPDFANINRANLEHRAPFYLLNPDVEGQGRRWWDRRLGPVLDVVDRDLLANRVFGVEYFGYHSQTFAHHGLRLPSQQYGFFLVRQALARGAVVVLTRSKLLWFGAVPELEGYSRLFTLRSARNATVSPRNCPEGFDEIVLALSDPVHEGPGPHAHVPEEAVTSRALPAR